MTPRSKLGGSAARKPRAIASSCHCPCSSSRRRAVASTYIWREVGGDLPGDVISSSRSSSEAKSASLILSVLATPG
eukprot:scaffold81905_cov39-Phaeocystis_antarctica.AAC.1